MRTTLSDIAEATGFSRSMVSMYLSGYRPVSQIPAETRKKIDAAVRKLNYRPSLLARSLRKGESRTLGVVISEITQPSVAYTVQWLLDRARQTGYQLLLTLPHYDKPEEEQSTRSLLARQVDGILYFLELKPEQQLYQDLKDSGVPVVLNNQPGSDFASVCCDLRPGLEQALNLFAREGAAAACIFGGDNNWIRAYAAIAAERELKYLCFSELLDSRKKYDAVADVLLAERPSHLLLTNRKFYRNLMIRFRKKDPAYSPRIIFGATIYTEILERPEILGVICYDRNSYLDHMLALAVESGRETESLPPSVVLPARLLTRELFHTLPNYTGEYD